MRKICFFLIVLLISLNIYADTDQLTVQLQVTEENDFEWFKGEVGPSSDTWKDNRAETETLTADSTLKVYPAVMTNKATPITLKITGGPLTNSSTSEVINLEATPSGDGAPSDIDSVVWTEADTDASIVFTEPERDSYGKRVYYGVLELSLPEGYGNAPALSSNYSATLTLTVDSQG